jgi:hypothetical protein
MDTQFEVYCWGEDTHKSAKERKTNILLLKSGKPSTLPFIDCLGGGGQVGTLVSHGQPNMLINTAGTKEE